LCSCDSCSRVHIAAVRLLLDGPYAPAFWVLVIGMGILLPLTIQLLAVNHKVKHTAVAPLLVLAGGLALRFVIVYAGRFSSWS
jgi:formate-dependent nitrite reductase membrane component NrfD